MVIGPNLDTVAGIVAHARATMGDADAQLVAQIASDSWASCVGLPARSQAAMAAAQVVYAAARVRAAGDVALAHHLDRVGETFAVAWRAELDVTTTAVPDHP